MPMSPFQYPQYGVPGFQPPTMQQMVGQGYSPAPSFHPQPGISGRVVTGPGEIQVQEVPTDGTVAWFPAADGSCVWGKRWTPDGSIQTVRYVAEAQEDASQADPVAQIDAKLDRALSMLGHILGEEDPDAGQR